MAYRKLSNTEKRVVRLLQKIDSLASEIDFDASFFGAPSTLLLLIRPNAEIEKRCHDNQSLSSDCIIFQSNNVKCSGGDPDII